MNTSAPRTASKSTKVSPSTGKQIASAKAMGKAGPISGVGGSPVRGFGGSGVNPNAVAGSGRAGTAEHPVQKGPGVAGFSGTAIKNGKV